MDGVFAELGEKSGDMLSFGIVKTEGKKAKAFVAKEGWARLHSPQPLCDADKALTGGCGCCRTGGRPTARTR